MVPFKYARQYTPTPNFLQVRWGLHPIYQRVARFGVHYFFLAGIFFFEAVFFPVCLEACGAGEEAFSMSASRRSSFVLIALTCAESPSEGRGAPCEDGRGDDDVAESPRCFGAPPPPSLRARKQSLQETGRSPLGLNGISHDFPQFAQTALYMGRDSSGMMVKLIMD